MHLKMLKLPGILFYHHHHNYCKDGVQLKMYVYTHTIFTIIMIIRKYARQYTYKILIHLLYCHDASLSCYYTLPGIRPQLLTSHQPVLCLHLSTPLAVDMSKGF